MAQIGPETIARLLRCTTQPIWRHRNCRRIGSVALRTIQPNRRHRKCRSIGCMAQYMHEAPARCCDGCDKAQRLCLPSAIQSTFRFESMTWDETFLERGWTFAGMTTGGGTFFERGWDALRMAEGEAYGETTLGGGTCVVAGRKAAFALQPASRTRRNCLQRKAPPRGMAPFCDAVCPFSRSSRPAHVRPGRRLRQWPCPCRSTCSRRACRRRRPCPPSRQAPRTARTARCCARR